MFFYFRLRNEVPIKKAGEKSCTTQFSFKKRDGSEMVIPIRSGLHSVSLKVSKAHCQNLLNYKQKYTVSNSGLQFTNMM